MAELATDLLAWAVGTVEPDAAVLSVEGLRDHSSPWLIKLRGSTGKRAVVLRVGAAGQPDTIETERLALELARGAGVPVPRLLGAGHVGDLPVLLIEAISGSSSIPAQTPVHRLRTLGAAAAALHRVAVPPVGGLPYRDRPIAGVDFAALRRLQPERELLRRAEVAVRSRRPDEEFGFVHGDLWQGNCMFDGDTLVALIDWDCAGIGPAGIDFGSLRCDAAICFGPEAAEEVLVGWEQEAGRPAGEVPYWDAVAALSTPPTMDWFVESIAGQGRSDLTRELLVERRDAFLAAALEKWPN